MPCAQVVRQACSIRQRLSIIWQVCRPIAQPRALLRLSNCALHHRAPGVDRTNQVGDAVIVSNRVPRFSSRGQQCLVRAHADFRASCRMACPSQMDRESLHWLLNPSLIIPACHSVRRVHKNLMQQLLTPRPVLLLLPRSHTHVRPVFGSRGRLRSLVTSASWQSWFAGSPRKQVPTCSS